MDMKISGVRLWVAVLLSIILVGAFVWLVVVVINAAGEVPTPYRVGDETKTASRYSDLKDILTILVPLVTIIIGFYFGSQGTAEAQKTANAAQDQANKKETQRSRPREWCVSRSPRDLVG